MLCDVCPYPIILKKEDENKEFAFGRAISDEKGCGILVEIFKIIGPMNMDYEKIINSGRLFDPVFIFWVGISEKRWKVIYQTPNYDKYKDSNYGEVEIIFGPYDDFIWKIYLHVKENKLRRMIFQNMNKVLYGIQYN